MPNNSSEDCNCILIMGVSGAGKTTIGTELSAKIGGKFVDADALHPIRNIEKMKNGLALTDQDREEWLCKIAKLIRNYNDTNTLVIACSALKETYRKRLGRDNYKLVYLKGSQILVEKRLASRKNHFMPVSLLNSQFGDLEEPLDALEISVSKSPVEIISTIMYELSLC